MVKFRKGVFFSTDALIALILIFLVLIVFYPIFAEIKPTSEVHYDVLNLLSSLKVGEIENSYAQALINSHVINNTNYSLLEQIGEFSLNDIATAKSFTQNVMSELDFGNENFGIWYNDALIYSHNTSSFEEAERVETARHIISGLKSGQDATGFAARAGLASNYSQRYYYFGGYAGDGNLSFKIDYEGVISSAEMEIAINKDFELFINGIDSGSYNKSTSEFTPSRYAIPATNFHTGSNEIKLIGNNLYIAGGFFKIGYKSDVEYEQPDKYHFPGVEGAVNVYDGFYVPGNLDGMKVNLHLNCSDIDVLLNIGNVTVFDRATLGEENITITDAELDSKLDYNFLSRKTVPIRLGLRESFGGENRAIDVFSAAELSGSMNQNVPAVGKKVLDLVQEGNEMFIYSILNISGSKLGLIGFSKDAEDATQQHDLSTDIVSLNNTVYSWKGGEGSCTCCGIDKAVEKLLVQSSPSRYRSIVLMSDGKANTACVSGDAKQDAINSACNAWENNGIQVHVIGFGPTTTIDEATLQAIAQCGNGTYIYASASKLTDAYIQMANLLSTFYVGQTVGVLGNIRMKLFPDSYIEFDYAKTAAPFGLYITSENSFSDAYSGSFNVPAGSQVLDMNVVSYSGPRWTDYVEVNGNKIYKLSDYGTNYIMLGDPYTYNSPVSLVTPGTNYVNLTTALNITSNFSGSVSNKIIYTLVRNVSVFSDIMVTANGCLWDVQFDGVVSSVAIPSSYTGTEKCVYNDTEQKISNPNDAYQIAVMGLLQQLDLNADGKVDVAFGAGDLNVFLDEVEGIPIPWSIEVEARLWY